MKTFRFMTSMKCAGCTASVEGVLDKIIGLRSWKFSLGNPEYNLEIESIAATAADITKAITDAGFSCKLVDGN